MFLITKVYMASYSYFTEIHTFNVNTIQILTIHCTHYEAQDFCCVGLPPKSIEPGSELHAVQEATECLTDFHLVMNLV